jgi:cation transport ATPase
LSTAAAPGAERTVLHVGGLHSFFFHGAVTALRARTLDMMVLVAVAIGTGRACSVAATY